MSQRWSSAVLVAVALAAACSTPEPRPREEASPAAALCPAGAPTSGYDQWAPGDRCRQLDQAWSSLPGSARRCTGDEECRLVVGPCFVTAVRKDALDPGQEAPCAHPAGGMCPPSGSDRAVCTEGCCVPAPGP